MQSDEMNARELWEYPQGEVFEARAKELASHLEETLARIEAAREAVKARARELERFGYQRVESRPLRPGQFIVYLAENEPPGRGNGPYIGVLEDPDKPLPPRQ